MIPTPVRVPYLIAADEAARAIGRGFIVYMSKPEDGMSVILLGPRQLIAAYVRNGKVMPISALREFDGVAREAS